MPPFVLIGLAAGLASAVLFASATAGGITGRFLLFFLAPLPGFLAGLGWGAGAAIVSGLATALGCAFLLSPMGALVVLVSQGLPIALICYLSQLSRPVAPSAPAGPGGSSEPGVEWYPLGRMVAILTLIAGVMAFLTLLMLGNTLDDVRGLLRELIEKVFTQQLPGFKDRKPEEAELKQLTEIALYAFPAASASSWLGGFLLNLYLAGRVTLASGRLARPWPDLAAMVFPRGFRFGLAIAVVVAGVTAGYPALIASGFVGAYLVAYLLLGLAILHYVTRGHAARPFILWGVYLFLFILNTWAGLVLALIGILEPILPWRRSNRPDPSGPQ